MKIVNPAIDSFKLRIKADKVLFTPRGRELLMERKVSIGVDKVKRVLNGEMNLDELESELEYGDFKRNAYFPEELEEKGIKLRFLVVRRDYPYKPELSGDYLEILLNSKLLKERYFEGITLDNILIILEEINSLGLFEINFDDFVNGSVVDVDIKADIEDISESEFRRFIDLLNNIKEGEIHKGEKNLGIQYSYRQNTSHYIGKPFVKFYYKPIELLNNSPIFYRLY